ncbi:CusA/CzcA family heavy metal efflux RND transporter [Roseomonas sp. NAR14]|uniref:CusA/CzcA family heavy metal efflux RND transporter n=1 Tax=Roseomonas acroporae TaxID=2937791 RepID=A0A9X1Y4H6_9PROT|nr:CusA/CzcA family heavy metal efflux RND transporter [Roseomonas acroporae]MCK8782890.1 CusA/CzcA family heavy metal efflux RND transporter [Roseomonas acroporae]
MLNRLVDLALRQRLMVCIAAIALAVWGASAYRSLPIDAFPDVSPTQVMVSMRANGLTPEELEARVTVPVELAMKGIPRLEMIRSTTRYSTALMIFEFAAGTDVYWARQQVKERLDDVEEQLPQGVEGGLAPIVTALGEMLMFTVEGGNLTPMERRFLIDWVIRPQVRGLPGVADVNAMGGYVRTYEVVPNTAALAARGLTTRQLIEALEANNRNDGAGRVQDGEEALLVRADGRIMTLQDVRQIVLVSRPGGVVRVEDVADVRFGALARNGVVAENGAGEGVWGTVLGLAGANARTVVDGVKAKFEEIRGQLPEGVEIVIFYDRADLIGQAVWTVQKVLIEAVVLVVVLLLLFLGGLRAAVVVTLLLPLAVLVTFGVMKLWGLSANIMSLGGLAIAIGLLVDCAVVVVENAQHRFATEKTPPDFRHRLWLVAESTREVMTPLVAGVVIIVTVFTPLLSLQGLEGKMFAPVALTISFALLSALILSLTVVPVLSAFVLRGGGKLDAHGHPREPWLVRMLHKGYDPFLAFVMRRPAWVFGAVAIGVVCAFLAYRQIGSTFVPAMDEGTPVLTVRKHPSISVEETAEMDIRIQRALMERVPEIAGIRSRSGADELGIDPVGLNDTDMFIQLRPRKEWRNKSTDWVIDRVREVMESFPGISYQLSQPIDMRVQEMVIGARGDVVVKVFGANLTELNRIAVEAAEVMRGIRGATDVYALRNEGMKYLTIKVDRLAAGRFGLSVEDVQRALRVWVDGTPAGIVLEGEARIPLMVRGEAILRRSAADLARVQLTLPGGGTVQLGQVAQIREEEGPVQVVREQAQRYATVLSNVRGRDLVGFVDEARAAVEQQVRLPAGYHLEWGGQFENQQRASARLAVVVPIALGAIFLLLYLTFGSVRQAVLVFCNVPFAAIGGIIGLWLSGEFLSVPASIGFIALIGIAVLNGVVLISYINRLLREEVGTVRDAVMEGAKRRMTPVTLTATIAAFGLVPFLFADGPGSEIQRPLAVVVIGGLVTATSLTLILLPILYDRFGVSRTVRESLERGHGMPAEATDEPPAPPAAAPKPARAVPEPALPPAGR